MKNLLFVLLLISFQINCLAEEEIYAVDLPDGGVSIVHYVVGSKDTLQDVLIDSGLNSLPKKKINFGDIPQSRLDRKFWKLDSVSKKIVVDKSKKDLQAAKDLAMESEKQAIYSKLKITPEEFEKIK